MIFNDCTSNGGFEFSVDPRNLFINGAHTYNRDRVPYSEFRAPMNKSYIMPQLHVQDRRSRRTTIFLFLHTIYSYSDL